jgi:hypothetical protein
MIIRPSVDTLLLVTQPDHAALAGAVMAEWQADGLPDHPVRDVILLATRAHDDGWREPDAAPTVDQRSGSPHDFLDTSTDIRQGIWPRGVERVAATNAYSAALVAHHALHVFRHLRDEPEWASFFAEMDAAEQAALARTPPETRRGWPGDYRFLFLGDLLSLIFCNGWTQPFEAEGYRIILTPDALTVTPDPFGGRPVPLAVAARRIPARRYTCDDDLRETLAAAPLERLESVAVGHDGSAVGSAFGAPHGAPGG